jgi:hypothetical protein
MALTEARRQELATLLEEAYNVKTETDRIFGLTTNPLEKARLEFDLEKAEANIQRLEKELEDEPLDEAAIVGKYLSAIREKYISYETSRLIRLATWRGDDTKPAENRPNLRKMEAFLEEEGTIRRPVKPVAETAAATELKEVSAENFLFQNKRIMLLGLPGTGKSITLLRLVKILGQPWQATGEDVTAMSLPVAWFNHVPIFAKLSRWTDPQMSLIDFLQSQLIELDVPELADTLPELMKSGRAVLLLDGLDKLPDLDPEQAQEKTTWSGEDPRIRSIAEFDYSNEWSKVACVISCRSKEAARGPSWPALQLLELKQKQVTRFATTYFERESDAEILTDGFITGLYKTDNSDALKLQGLVSRPFYLVKMLAYYHIQKSNGLSDADAMPFNFARYCKFCVSELLNREVTNGWLSEDEAEELHNWLALLAYKMTDTGQKGRVSKTLAGFWLFELIKRNSKDTPITAEEKAKVTRFWYLAEGSGFMTMTDTHAQFFCEAIQDYFCTSYFAAQPLEVGQLEQAAQPRFKAIWPLWAKLDKNLRANLINFVQNNYDDKASENAATALSYLNDDRVIEPLVELLSNPDPQIRARAVKALGGLKNEQTMPQFIQALKDKDTQVRVSAVNVLVGFGEAGLRPVMNMLRDPDNEVRCAAASALGRLANPQALNTLSWLEQNEKGLTPESIRFKEALTAAISQIAERNKA